MKGKTRFLRSIIAAAETYDGKMPWARGTTRLQTTARRNTSDSAQRSA